MHYMEGVKKMQKSTNVNVKLTLKDIKGFSVSKALQGKSIKLKLFGVVFFTIMFIFLITVIASVPPIDDLSIRMLLITVAVYLFFMAILFGPILIIYLVESNNYKKSPILHHMNLYTLTDEGITLSSNSGVYNLKWSEISKVQELKPCFVITDILGKCYVIPKRCFDNEEHLNDYIRIMLSRINKSKFKLSAMKFNNFSPDYKKSTIISQTHLSTELNEPEPFSEIKVLYNKRELLRINYTIYYTSLPGIILSVLGLLFLSSFVKMLIYGYINFISLIIALFMGFNFTFLIPISFFIKTSIQFKKSDMMKNSYTYKFYSDYFIVNHPSNSNRILWSELVKATEQRSSILLYQTTQLAHIIPKNAFQNNEEQLNLLRKVISEKSPRAKICV